MRGFMRYNYPQDIEEALTKLGFKVGWEAAYAAVTRSKVACETSMYEVKQKRIELINSALLHLYESHEWSMRKIGNEIGVSYGTIYHHLHHCGAKIRQRGGVNHVRK
jgi:hypothetical protein